MITAIGVAAWLLVPPIAAGALLQPVRAGRTVPPPAGCVERPFGGDGVTLSGWFCAAAGPRRGTLISLHGVADTRAGAAGIVPRFVARGLDVVAYDSRAHGGSGGEHCTYGYWEKRDLRRVIDSLPSAPVVLLGTSLGAAVALQGAAGDDRVKAIVAAEVFSDLETIVRDRTPWFVPWWIVERALHEAEARAGFRVADVSPMHAARSIDVPVLLVHGRADTDTPPDHSGRVLGELRGRKRLMLVDGARHNESLRPAYVWEAIDGFLDEVLRGLATPDAGA